LPVYDEEEMGMVEDFDAMFNVPLNFDDLKGLSNVDDEYEMPEPVPEPKAQPVPQPKAEAKVVEAIKVATASVKAAKAKKVIVEEAAEKLEEIVETEQAIVAELVKSATASDVKQEVLTKTVVHSGAALADIKDK